MTVGSMLARNHNVLAKACLGGGFAYGFAYTNTHGSSPLKDAAVTAGLEDANQQTTFTIRTSHADP